MSESTLELVVIGRDDLELEHFELNVNMPKACITRLLRSTEYRDHACAQQALKRSLAWVTVCIFC